MAEGNCGKEGMAGVALVAGQRFSWVACVSSLRASIIFNWVAVTFLDKFIEKIKR